MMTIDLYQSLLKQAIRNHTHRGFIDFEATFSLSMAINEVTNAGYNLLHEGNLEAAFAIGSMVAAETVEVIQNCDDSDGSIGDDLDYALALVYAVAALDDLPSTLRDTISAWVNEALLSKVYGDYGDFDEALLKTAQLLAR